MRDAPPPPQDPKAWWWSHVWDRCAPHIRQWGVPPRWSPGDWWAETRAEAGLAYCEALRTFDPARGAPWDEYVHQRVLARVWARLRRERAFGRRHEADDSGSEPAVVPAPTVDRMELLDRVLDHLEEADRQFLQQLYHEGRTEKELAALLGTTRSAVSKRKRRLLQRLRRLWEKIDAN